MTKTSAVHPIHVIARAGLYVANRAILLVLEGEGCAICGLSVISPERSRLDVFDHLGERSTSHELSRMPAGRAGAAPLRPAIEPRCSIVATKAEVDVPFDHFTDMQSGAREVDNLGITVSLAVGFRLRALPYAWYEPLQEIERGTGAFANCVQQLDRNRVARN